jgi:hypothetical protein
MKRGLMWWWFWICMFSKPLTWVCFWRLLQDDASATTTALTSRMFDCCHNALHGPRIHYGRNLVGEVWNAIGSAWDEERVWCGMVQNRRYHDVAFGIYFIVDLVVGSRWPLTRTLSCGARHRGKLLSSRPAVVPELRRHMKLAPNSSIFTWAIPSPDHTNEGRLSFPSIPCPPNSHAPTAQAQEVAS